MLRPYLITFPYLLIYFLAVIGLPRVTRVRIVEREVHLATRYTADVAAFRADQ